MYFYLLCSVVGEGMGSGLGLDTLNMDTICPEGISSLLQEREADWRNLWYLCKHLCFHTRKCGLNFQSDRTMPTRGCHCFFRASANLA